MNRTLTLTGTGTRTGTGTITGTLAKTTMTCTPTMPLRGGVAGQGVFRGSARLTLAKATIEFWPMLDKMLTFGKA